MRNLRTKFSRKYNSILKQIFKRFLKRYPEILGKKNTNIILKNMSNELLFVIPGFYCENDKTLEDQDVEIIEVLGEDDNRENYFKIRGSNKSLHENTILDSYYRIELAPNQNLLKKPKKINLGKIEDLAVNENVINETHEETFQPQQETFQPQQKSVNIPVIKQISFEEELVNKLIETNTDSIKEYSIKIELPFDVISISSMLKNFNINEKQALEIMMKNSKFQQAVLNSLVSIFDSEKVELTKVTETKKEEIQKEETLVNSLIENQLIEIKDKLSELSLKSDEIHKSITTKLEQEIIYNDSSSFDLPGFDLSDFDLPETTETEINNKKFNPIIEKYLNPNT